MQAKQPHILILPKWYPHTADPQNGIFIQGFARTLAAGQKVSVIFPVAESHNNPPEFKTEGNLAEILVPYRASKTRWMPLRKLVNFFRFRRAVKKGASILLEKRGKPDLIHAQVLIRAALFARRLARTWNIPWMLTEHSSEFLEAKPFHGHFLKQYIIRSLCRDAHAVTTVSETLAKGLSPFCEQKEIHVIPNIIAFPEISPGKKNEVLTFTAIGDMVDDVKNFSGILRAVARIENRLPEFKFILAGEGPDKQYLKVMSESLKISHRVSFPGRLTHPEVLRLLQQVDFLITNSRKETFSMVTAEAVAAGKPVIITRCGGPEEWFIPEYGIMTDNDDESALCNSILEMAAQHSHYNSLDMANLIRQKFDGTLILQSYRHIYQNLLTV